jgi:hypothetical protein
LIQIFLCFKQKTMTNQEKAVKYGELLNLHTRIQNKVSEIKGQDIDLNQQQLSEIRKLENQLVQITEEIKRIMI